MFYVRGIIKTAFVPAFHKKRQTCVLANVSNTKNLVKQTDKTNIIGKPNNQVAIWPFNATFRPTFFWRFI